MSVKSIAVTAILCLAPMAALAQTAETTPPAASADAAGKGERWQACAAEIAKFCGAVERGKGKIRSCLEGHSAELSAGCKTFMAERAARAKDKDAKP